MKTRQAQKIKRISKLIAEAEGIRSEIYKKIIAVPQNPDIKELHINYNKAFEMSSKNLTADMVISPSYYNFKVQACTIIAYLDKKPIDQFEEILQELVTPNTHGQYILKGQGYAYRIHPEVVEHIKNLI